LAKPKDLRQGQNKAVLLLFIETSRLFSNATNGPPDEQKI
jgi:hypothetical protein